MKNIINKIGAFCRWCWSVIERNGTFCVFMYALGVIVAYATLKKIKGVTIYEDLYTELFVDVYILALILRVLPHKLMVWVRGLFYVIAYSLALIDVYCFVKFESEITPTMLMLVGETNSREAGEFFQNLVTLDVVSSQFGWILLLMLVHILWSTFSWLKNSGRIKTISLNVSNKVKCWIRTILGIITLTAFITTAIITWPEKTFKYDIMTTPTIGVVEHKLQGGKLIKFYQPIYRLIFSEYSNSLVNKQVQTLIQTIDKVKVDSCSFTSPNIVLIIGESYNRHHSQQYGYWQPTTPRQIALEKTGLLTKYTDVVTPWNLTSFVFKYMFSTYTVGDPGDWCDYPLFTELFRAAGYHVTFITNQFLPKAKDKIFDFSGGFFLNDPTLSVAQFDTRNERVYSHDDSLLVEYDHLKSEEKAHNLTIFHLYGQHVGYMDRYPAEQKHFKGDDYIEKKPGYNKKEHRIMADYDNATLYNDSIVDQIVKRFENHDAIVIYVPDHGEECYEDGMHFFCRVHSAHVNARIAHQEFEIPFWIYCSPKYIANHPQIYKEVVAAKDRRFMTDAMPHVLLYLAGIHSKDYRDDCNILSPYYDERRPRMLKKDVDYDKLH